MRKSKLTAIGGIFVLCLFAIVSTAGAQTTAFSYQGKLNDGGNPANGNYEMEFKLFDALMGGAQVGGTVTDPSVAVINGTFAATLDFGPGPFNGGSPRYLEIAVRPMGNPNPFTILAPRQPINSAPYSIQARNASQLGGVASSQYLQTNGNGSGLTNLNAASISTGTLNNARLGQIPTANIADNAVTSPKIASGQVVKGVTVGATTLTDNVTLAQGSNIGITTTGNTVTINSTSGGVGGSGGPSTIPVWSTATTLGTSLITQNANGVQLPNGVQLAAGMQGNSLSFGSPNGETGLSIAGATGRADVRFDGLTNNLRLFNGPAGGPPSNGISVSTTGGATITGTNGDGSGRHGSALRWRPVRRHRRHDSGAKLRTGLSQEQL